MLAREALLWAALAAGLALWVQLAAPHALWALPLWLLAALALFLFRDPEREVPPHPLGVVAPADGRVERIEEEADDPFLERTARRIVIRMRPWGPFVVRAPIEGRVVERWLRPCAEGGCGRRYAIWLQTDERDDVVLVLEEPARWRRPVCVTGVGERVGQGQRCGYVRFGGRVEVWVPRNARLDVGPGSRVRAGSTILATLVHD